MDFVRKLKIVFKKFLQWFLDCIFCVCLSLTILFQNVKFPVYYLYYKVAQSVEPLPFWVVFRFKPKFGHSNVLQALKKTQFSIINRKLLNLKVCSSNLNNAHLLTCFKIIHSLPPRSLILMGILDPPTKKIFFMDNLAEIIKWRCGSSNCVIYFFPIDICTSCLW